MSEVALDYQIRPITVDEYHRMGEAGLFHPGERVELLDGESIAMAPIGHTHGFRVRSLAQTFIERFGKRSIVDIGGNVILGDRSEPQPDLMLLEAKPSRYRDAVPRGEDVLLLVEVSDTSPRNDRGRKLDVYALAGIREVWIVRHRDSGDRFQSQGCRTNRPSVDLSKRRCPHAVGRGTSV